MTANQVWTSPMMNGERPVTILEEWRVVDRWWTSEPIVREYRHVELDGRRFTEKREPGGTWAEYPD